MKDVRFILCGGMNYAWVCMRLCVRACILACVRACVFNVQTYVCDFCVVTLYCMFVVVIISLFVIFLGIQTHMHSQEDRIKVMESNYANLNQQVMMLSFHLIILFIFQRVTSSESIVVTIIKFGMVTASGLRMHHMWIILTLTFKVT